jgi:BirA family biotin operon repressor/biotin-[acetyl-CoA-carboxylase] ligase
VIGIGLNVRLSDAVRREIGQAVSELANVCGRMFDRNVALARVLIELRAVLEAFARDGFAPLRAEWQRHHAWQDRRVTVVLPDGRRESGVARGVDEDGALIVAARAGIRRYHSAEVSLRSTPGVSESAREGA